MERRKINFNSAGFTLVELVVAIAVIAILAGIAIPRFLEAMETSRQATDLDNARTAESLANIRYITDSESGTVEYYFDRDTGRVLKASEVSSIAGYGLSEIETSTSKETQETIYNTNDITNISGVPKNNIVRIKIDPEENNIYAYWVTGVTGSDAKNSSNVTSILDALNAAIEENGNRLGYVTSNYQNGNYGYVYVDGNGILASTAVTMQLLKNKGLVNDYWCWSNKGNTNGYYLECGSDDIACSATEAYDAYQLNFYKNEDGTFKVKAVAVKYGQDGRIESENATAAFCAATGYDPDDTYDVNNLLYKNTWSERTSGTKEEYEFK